MMPRLQRTLVRPAEISGFGLFTSQDVRVRILPAPEHHGVAFQRVDLPGKPRIPALIRYVQPGLRRTVLTRGAAQVQVVEHLLAALAGLRVDNCLVQMDASEPPGGDGSSEAFVAALLDAGIREQSSRRRVIVIGESEIIASPDGRGHISVSPTRDGRFQLTYELDYPQPVIGRQACSLDVTPTTFVRELSFARTFVLEGEVAAMRSQGFGKRATTDNLIVFSSDGPIDTELRAPDECARHKALDCIGDFSLVGCDLVGHVQCCGSGHALNHELIRRLEQRLRGCPPLSATG